MNEDVRYEELVLSALLHDIGKVAQRAGDDSCKTQKMDAYLLPKDKSDRYTHVHAWYTHGAILKIFQDNNCFPDIIRPENVANIAASHHSPHNWAEWIIAESDRISSGADRLEKDVEAEQSGSFIEQAELSIFHNISLKSKSQNVGFYYKAAPLAGDKIYPGTEIKNSKELYSKIWESLLGDIKAVQETDFHRYIIALDAVLEHYTWAIPSSTRDLPDISLYDHLRTTTAFASVMYRYHEANRTLGDASSIQNAHEKKYLLLTGDISGIQRYLFDLKTTKSNAKMLRARSFEIREVTDSVVRFILAKFKLTPFEVLSSAGGRFMMVLPNTEDYREKLKTIRQKIDMEFLERYMGFLSMSIADPLEVARTDFMIQDSKFESSFRELQRLSGESKNRKLREGLLKYGHVMNFHYKDIDTTIHEGGSVCPMCDIRPVRPGADFCEYCTSLVTSGAKLPKSRYVVFNTSGFSDMKLINGESLSLSERAEDFPSPSIVYSVNKYEPGKGIARLPYAVARNEQGRVKDFGELSDLVQEGVRHLAIFKADLDNLGSVFSKGFASHLSISRYAALSRMLDYFFSVRVREIIEDEFSSLYTIYSGGDDLCVIGPWQATIEFAIRIQRDFTRFVGDNPSLTISAGIALISKSLPVARMIEEAECQLEIAKNTETKNRICILDLPSAWDEFSALIDKGKEMSHWLKDEHISTSIVYALIGQSARAEALMAGNINKENALWKGHFLYSLRRAEDRKEISSEIVNSLKEFAVTEGSMKYARIPATYALYENRNDR